MAVRVGAAESLPACPSCHELHAWDAAECGCGQKLVSDRAQVTPAYGMRAVSGWGVRGYRAHCPRCGLLSRVYGNYNGALGAVRRHRQKGCQ